MSRDSPTKHTLCHILLHVSTGLSTIPTAFLPLEVAFLPRPTACINPLRHQSVLPPLESVLHPLALSHSTPCNRVALSAYLHNEHHTEWQSCVPILVSPKTRLQGPPGKGLYLYLWTKAAQRLAQEELLNLTGNLKARSH